MVELYEAGAAPDYDGVAEVWWDDRGAFERAQQSPEYRAMLGDAQHFIGSSMTLLATEVPLVDGYPSPGDRASMVKYIAMLLLKEGVPIEEFQRHWKSVHGPINVRSLKGMHRYVQSHVLPDLFDGPNPPPYGGLPEAWFDSIAAMRDRPRDPDAPRDSEWPNHCSGQSDLHAGGRDHRVACPWAAPDSVRSRVTGPRARARRSFPVRGWARAASSTASSSSQRERAGLD